MKKEMLINVSEGEECRIALLEDGRLEELYMERTSATSHVNNIYKGRVTNVEPSIQAAFVDFGLGRNGFLHISDLMPTYFGRKGEGIEERVGQKMARRDRPPIQRCLRRGDEIVVQIIKEGIGTKGPTLSTYLSIPGQILVMMPGMESMGVSRKIEDDAERRRLRQILDSLRRPDDVGFIIRTNGVGKTKAEIERDLKYLVRLWDNFVKRRDSGPGPMELYTEGDLVTRTVRDLFSADIDRIVIDNKDVAKRVKEVIKLANPRAKNKVELYEDAVPLFHEHGIEREIELMYSRHVPLPSGGSLVIDSTEAIVAIDVNSGKFRDHSDAETTAFKTDMEAADEICRQLRLRDLGGVIICDFIDLRYERHRRELEKRLHDNLRHDRAKTKVLRMSQFGIIEMTRQRMRPSLKRSVYADCPHCKGAGLVKTPESMSLDVMRRLAIAINDLKVHRVELAVCPDVSFYLQNKKRRSIAALETEFSKRVVIRSDPSLGLDEMRLDLFDNRDGMVVLEELGGVLSQPPHRTQLGTRGAQGQQRGGGRFDDRRGGGRPSEAQRGGDGRGGGGRDRGRDQRQLQDQRGGRHGRDEETGAAEERFDRSQAEAAFDDEEESTVPVESGTGDDREADDHGGEDVRALPEESGQRGADGEGQPGAPEAQEGDEGGARRRRRRRRGRRGRGRGGQQGDQQGQEFPRAGESGGADARDHDAHAIGDDDRGAGGREDEGAEEDDRSVEAIAEADELQGTFRDGSSEAVESASSSDDSDRERVESHGEDDEDDEAVRPAEEVAGTSGDNGSAEGEGAPRKRRRRRGGRGRRRAGARSEDGTTADNGAVEGAGASPDAESENAAAPAAAERPSRGASRSSGRRTPPARTPPARPQRGGGNASTAEESPATAAPTPRRAAAPPPPAPRTGSTDRHLMRDEPVIPEPVRRPRRSHDLDEIPDDLD